MDLLFRYFGKTIQEETEPQYSTYLGIEDEILGRAHVLKVSVGLKAHAAGVMGVGTGEDRWRQVSAGEIGKS